MLSCGSFYVPSLEFAWENTNWANSLCVKVSNRSVRTKLSLTGVCFWFWKWNSLDLMGYICVRAKYACDPDWWNKSCEWTHSPALFFSSYNHTDWPPIDSVLITLSMWLPQADRSVWWACGKIYTATHCHHDIAAIHLEQMTKAYLNFTSLANTAQYKHCLEAIQ